MKNQFCQITGHAILSTGMLLATTAPAWANGIGGCVDSPENATLLLVALGGAVAGWPSLRKMLDARRRRTERHSG